MNTITIADSKIYKEMDAAIERLKKEEKYFREKNDWSKLLETINKRTDLQWMQMMMLNDWTYEEWIKTNSEIRKDLESEGFTVSDFLL